MRALETLRKVRVKIKVIIFLILLTSCNVKSACFPDLIDYSLEGELKRSSSVIIATPISKTWVDDEEDPGFYAGAIYQLDIHEVLIQKNNKIIELWDSNDSGRFAPEIGKRYLMFVQLNSDGKYVVSYCGNSGLYQDKTELINKLKRKIN